MPLTQEEQVKFRNIARQVGVSPGKIDKMIDIAGKLKDKKVHGFDHGFKANYRREGETGIKFSAQEYDLTNFSKDVYGLYMSPDLKKIQQESALGALEIIIAIAILWFILHYFADDIQKLTSQKLREVKESINTLVPSKN
jgi:hypothetical protein